MELDYAPGLPDGPSEGLRARRAARHAIAPQGLDHVFFTNSGSESVETALKIALAYQRVKGEGGRTRLIGRERGYHGVNFGGISVGGMVANRKQFGTLLAGVDHHPPHPRPRPERLLARPAGARRGARRRPGAAGRAARRLDHRRGHRRAGRRLGRRAAFRPRATSSGCAQICDKHGILLIFDEVITGFGRLGAPFGADYFGVTPDIMTTAKGLTNGVVPMGAVFVKKEIYEAFMNGPEHLIEFFHGYTYSGNPVVVRGRPRHARHLPARGPAHPRVGDGRSTGRTRSSA